MKIAILGGGNLGVSLALGLIISGSVKPENIIVTRRRTAELTVLKKKRVKISDNNVAAVSESDLIFLTVKPKQSYEVLKEIKSALVPHRHVIISTVTGLKLSEIQSIVGNRIALFRAMPNTALSICESMTCLSCIHTSPDIKVKVSALFEKMGNVVFIDEQNMEAATVLGACGIAFALKFIRSASQGGIEIGFNSKDAQLIASQTVKGAAALLLEGGFHPEQEIDKVTTPQGCTIAGLNEMEHQGFSSALIKGITTSYKKIESIR